MLLLEPGKIDSSVLGGLRIIETAPGEPHAVAEDQPNSLTVGRQQALKDATASLFGRFRSRGLRSV